MLKRYYHKLIRDRIPEIITNSSGKYLTKVLTQKEYEKELKRKLIEESKELINAPKKDVLDELADVLEVIKSLADYYKINFNKVEETQKNKRRERGSFKKKLYLIWSSNK